MIDDCPMTEDCPGYDRDRRACLLRPGDCEFAPADGDTDVVFETPEAPTAGGSAEAGPRQRESRRSGDRRSQPRLPSRA